MCIFKIFFYTFVHDLFCFVLYLFWVRPLVTTAANIILLFWVHGQNNGKAWNESVGPRPQTIVAELKI